MAVRAVVLFAEIPVLAIGVQLRVVGDLSGRVVPHAVAEYAVLLVGVVADVDVQRATEAFLRRDVVRARHRRELFARVRMRLGTDVVRHGVGDHEEHISRSPRNRKVVRGQRLAALLVVLAQELRPARGRVRIEKTALDRSIARAVGALEDLDRRRGIGRKVVVDRLRVVEESDDFLKIGFIHQLNRLIARRKGVAGTSLRNTNVVLDAVDHENMVVIVLAQPANGIRHIAAIVADRNGAAVARPGEKIARALRTVRQGAGVRAAIEHERRAALLGGDDTAGITTVRRDRAVVHAVLQRDARAARRLAENAGRTARAIFRIRDRRLVREVFKRHDD